MSSWPLVKYVDSPATTATVRYDFNDQTPASGPVKKVTEFDPGVPTLEGDPDAVGQAWGFRSPSITHTIKGTKSQAMAALSAVSREQLRRTNWLLFQPAAGVQPVWFKTYRTSYQPVTLDQVFVRVNGGGTAPLPDTWKITVPLVADAFAYGARVSLPSATFANALAATNPMQMALPALKGDAPTGLRVSLTPIGAGDGTTQVSELLVGVVSSDAATAPVVTQIADTATSGWGAGTGGGITGPTTNANYLSGKFLTVTMGAGVNFTERLTGNAFIGSIPPSGRYKALLRVEADPTSSSVPKQYLFALGIATTGTSTFQYLPTVTLQTPNQIPGVGSSAYAFQGWVDLGEVTLPFGVELPSDVSLSMPNVGLALKVGTADGSTGVVRVDVLKFVPVDGPTVRASRFARVLFDAGATLALPSIGPMFATPSNTLTLDGQAERCWVTSSTTVGTAPPGMRGSYPVADPAAAENLLVCIPVTRGRNQSTTVAMTIAAKTWTMNVSYAPRYLHVGDGT